MIPWHPVLGVPFDPANNDGSVLFKVRTLSNLQLGYFCDNEETKCFYFNFPIETNNYVTTIDEALGIVDFNFDDQFIIYPNPANQVLNLHVKMRMGIESLEVFNSLGQLVIAQLGPSELIRMEELVTGLYFLKIRSDQGISISEFIK